jgi:hypothetical protein
MKFTDSTIQVPYIREKGKEKLAGLCTRYKTKNTR